MQRHTTTFSRPDFEPSLTRGDRKAQGIYYTPPELVRQVVCRVLGPILNRHDKKSEPLRILDPSCGAGEFVVGAFDYLAPSAGSETARTSIWGIDVDALAIEVARSRLLARDGEFVADQILCGDALTTRCLMVGSFDAIIGNPPYINIRQLAKRMSQAKIDLLRQKYSTARGNFDLYVLFIERAVNLLRPGGRCGLIIPGKWATLDYARECRKLLLEKTTIEQVVDLSHCRVFADANVYPHILIFEKAVAKKSHVVRFSVAEQTSLGIPQKSLADNAFQFSRRLDVESRGPVATLGSVAKMSCGTAGYAAQKIASRLVEEAEFTTHAGDKLADFITSGNIDRYRIEPGGVRYLNHYYLSPKLPLAAAELTPAKQKLFASPKIVVAGMSRRLEAAWDEAGLALGVQVYAIHEWQVDPFYLLGLLNSKLLSYLFASRYAAKRLGGGYLAINKSQLVNLPIRVVGARDRADALRIRRLSHLARDWSPAHEGPADNLVYELYRLTDAEIGRVEAHFAEAAAQAA